LPDDKVIEKPRVHSVITTTAIRIGCIKHPTNERFEIAWVDKYNLLLIRCLECPKGTEVLRIKASGSQKPPL
jgi:desulfoferrodoxin (superoxide reductase-like protein)